MSDDYLENSGNASEFQESSVENTKSIQIKHSFSVKLFDSEKTNNLIYFNEVEGQNKEDNQPSIPTTIASSFDQISPTPSPQHQGQEQQHKKFNCFYCSQSYSSDKERIKHIDYEHPGKLYYPTQEDFERRLL